ncbi:MAG: OmpP1/FadL family transporter [Alphaproteobacteria bacterium]
METTRNVPRRAGLVLAAAIACWLTPRPASAGGFQLNEMAPRYLGTALAGMGSEAIDASVGYYNPAGLTRVKSGSLSATAAGVFLDTTVRATEATTLDGHVNVTGNNGKMSAYGGKNAFIPAGQIAQRVSDDFVLYFGLTGPYGLITDYPDTGVTRYMATLSKVTTFNLNPAVAWSLGRWVPGLSIGAGFNAQYARARINRNVLFGAPPDLIAEIAGEDWAFGWNAGAMYEFNEHARVGVSWRSMVAHRFSGFVETWSTGSGASLFRGGAHASAQFPNYLIASGYWEPTPIGLPGLALMGEFGWTQWSQIQRLPFEFSGVPLPNAEQVFNFTNAWRLSAGAAYKIDDAWTVRIGTGYDGSPVNNSNRTVNLPDARRILIGAGFSWMIEHGVSIDVGYLHLFVQDGSIDQTNTSVDHSRFVGTVSSQTNVIGAQFNWNWDEFPPRLPLVDRFF